MGLESLDHEGKGLEEHKLLPRFLAWNVHVQVRAPEVGEQNHSASILRLSPSREIIAYLNNGLHRLNLALYQYLIGHNFWSCSAVSFFLFFLFLNI